MVKKAGPRVWKYAGCEETVTVMGTGAEWPLCSAPPSGGWWALWLGGRTLIVVRGMEEY